MSKSLLLLVALALCAAVTSAMYAADDDVVVLTEANWNAEVTESAQSVLVEFYAPWCGHCKQLTPLWKETATVLKGFVGVGALDVPANEKVIGDNKLADAVTGFPTILFFGADGGKAVEYEGDRSVKALVTFAFKEAKALIKTRLDGNGGDAATEEKAKPAAAKKPEAKKPEAKKAEEKKAPEAASSGAGESVELTGANFDEKVLQSDDVWFVEFFGR
jgi:protein disulfide-isomerase A6